MPVTNTIKSDGTGDYTTAQAWETAVDGLAMDTYTGECYEGGDLGAVTFADVTNGKTMILTPATGHGHNGSTSDGAYMTATTGSVVSVSQASNIEVRGMRLLKTQAGGSGVIATSATITNITGIIFDGNMVVQDFSVAGNFANGISAHTAYDGVSVSRTSNNIVVFTGSGNVNSGIGISVSSQAIFATGFVHTHNATVYNNTIVGNSLMHTGIQVARAEQFGGEANLNVTLRNNVVIGSTTFGMRTSTNTGVGTLTVTSSNNATQDTTASTWGGTGHLTSIVPADEFVDPASDWSIWPTSNLLEAGFDLSGTFTNDAYGNTRAVPYNIGAYEDDPVEPPTPTASSQLLFPTLFPM